MPPDVSNILEFNFKYRVTLFDILITASPLIELKLCTEFRDYLQLVVASSNTIDILSHLDTKSCPNLILQERILEKFHLSNNNNNCASFLDLFYCLVGSVIKYNVVNTYSLYYVDLSSKCIFKLNAKSFYYKNNIQKQAKKQEGHSGSTETQFDNVFKRMTGELNIAGHLTNQQAINQTNYLEYKNEKRYRMQFKKPNQLNRKSMFYSRCTSGRVCLKTFPCNSNLEDNLIVKSIKSNIFISIGNNTKTNIDQPKKLDIYVLKIYHNYRKCKFDEFLRDTCDIDFNKKTSLQTALSLNTVHKNLFQFIYSVYQFIFPVNVFGSRHNFMKFFENIKLIFTSNYITNFQIWNIIYGLRMEDMRPMFEDFYCDAPNRIDHEIEIYFLCWVFDCLRDILRAKFFVTESAHLKYTLLYYRYDLWARINLLIIKQYTSEGKWTKSANHCHVNGPSINNLYDYFRHSKYRFIPKSLSVRAITGFRLRAQFSQSKKLTEILNLLTKFRRVTAPHPINDYGSIHDGFVKCKQNYYNGMQNSRYYVIRGDFQDCYPSIILAKLELIILQTIKLLTMDWICERISINHIMLPKILQIEKIKIVTKRNKFYTTKTDFVIKRPDMPRESVFGVNIESLNVMIKEQLGVDSVRNSIVESAGAGQLHTSETIQLLRVYLYDTCIRLGNKSSCNLKRGIRQGGKLSTVLSEIYLNYFWYKFFTEFKICDFDFFSRVADDFLYVTNDFNRAKLFQQKILTNNKFRLRVQMNKFKTNFDIDTGRIISDCHVTFIGRKLYTNDLTFGIDLDSFANLKITDTFSCNPFANVFDLMKSLVAAINVGVYPEMFDCSLIHKCNVIQNLLDKFLLQALRLAGFLCQSPRWRNHSSHNLANKIYFFTYQLAKRLFGLLVSWVKEKRITFLFKHTHVQLIAASAFKLLWNNKHKLTCRTAEKDSINMYHSLISSFSNINFELPTKLYAPFDQIDL